MSKKKQSVSGEDAMAMFEAGLELGKKGKRPVKKKERSGLVRTDLIVGDGLATVYRGRMIKRAIPFGEAAISSSCNVSLTCNQDSETILKAGKIAMDIVMRVLREDASDMEEFINEAMQEVIRRDQ